MSWGIIHLAGPLPLILLKEGIWGTGHGPWPPSTNGCWHGGLWRGQELTPVCQLMDQPWQTTSSTTGASNNWTSARKGLTSTCTTSRCSCSYIRWRIGRSWLWCRWCCWTRSGWWTSRQGSCSTWWSRDGDLGGKFAKRTRWTGWRKGHDGCRYLGREMGHSPPVLASTLVARQYLKVANDQWILKYLKLENIQICSAQGKFALKMTSFSLCTDMPWKALTTRWTRTALLPASLKF